jgi:SAM-dependent methyltransferase
LQLVPSFHDSQAPDYKFERYKWENEESVSADASSRRITNLINYSGERRDFPGQIFPSYYDVDLGGKLLKGLRAPKDRLELLPIDFKEKSVLDIGCNFGGMLHCVAPELDWGIGVDYDSRLINIANVLAPPNVCFFVHDLERDPVDLIRDMMLEKYVDVVFLLATCAHIKNWEEVIEFAASVSRVMVFEANGHEHAQLGQIRCLHRLYESVDTLANKGAPGVGARRLFLCSNPGSNP